MTKSKLKELKKELMSINDKYYEDEYYSAGEQSHLPYRYSHIQKTKILNRFIQISKQYNLSYNQSLYLLDFVKLQNIRTLKSFKGHLKDLIVEFNRVYFESDIHYLVKFILDTIKNIEENMKENNPNGVVIRARLVYDVESLDTEDIDEKKEEKKYVDDDENDDTKLLRDNNNGITTYSKLINVSNYKTLYEFIDELRRRINSSNSSISIHSLNLFVYPSANNSGIIVTGKQIGRAHV